MAIAERAACPALPRVLSYDQLRMAVEKAPSYPGCQMILEATFMSDRHSGVTERMAVTVASRPEGDVDPRRLGGRCDA
jgi:hypothetical protein